MVQSTLQTFDLHLLTLVVPRRFESQWTCVSPLKMMVCLNGVHVEAQRLMSVTTAVTLALAFYYASVGGRPLHSSTLIWRLPRYVLSVCVVWLFHLLLSVSVFTLSALFSFLQDTSEFMHLIKTVQHETQAYSPHFLLNQRKSWSNVKTKYCNQVKRLNWKQEWALHCIKVKYQYSFFFPLL